MRINILNSCWMVSLCSVMVIAEAAQTTDKKPLSGQSELGYVQTAGNTKTQTVNAKLKVDQNISAWENSYALEALNSAQEEQTSAEKYAAKAQGNRLFTAKNYGFAVLTYDDDRFSGFDYESTAALGYGRKVIEEAQMKLSLEAGPGARVTQVEDSDQETEAILRTSGHFEYAFTETSKFEQTLSVEGGEDRVISKSVSALSSQIVGSLAMKLSLSVKNNSDPAVLTDETLKKTDSETAVTLVYGF